MIKKCIGILFYILIFNSLSTYAQLNFLNPEFFSLQDFNYSANKSDQKLHKALRPFLIDNSLIQTKENARDTGISDFNMDHGKSWFYRKLLVEPFIQIKSDDFILVINPLYNFEFKKEVDNSQNHYSNTRGIEVKGHIDNKIYFYSSFYENQARFESYVADYISETLVVPGQGAPKFKDNNVVDFSMSEAWISFKIGSPINVLTGYSKNFIGEGYRSLILSDNASNCPFLSVMAEFGDFQYGIIWSQHQLFEKVYYNYHFRKYNAINYLSWAPNNGFELALFESIEWPGNEPGETNFTLNFFNPVLLWRTAQYGLNSDKNVLLGLNSKIKLYNQAQIYQQFVLDNIDNQEKSNNNFAFQIGFKHFDLFHNKLIDSKMYAQLEYNYIAPYTYSNNNPKQSFSHYNQPLAHPAGSGLKESVAILEYSYKNLHLRALGVYLVNSIDTLNSNFGSNIFLSNEQQQTTVSHIGNKPGQGIENKILNIKTELILLINQANKMEIFSGLTYRSINNRFENKKDLIFTFGLRTHIRNYYYDYL